MTHYYYSSDGVIRSYATTTTTWTISPSNPCKQRKPKDDFPEDNKKLDKFLEAFVKE